MKPYFALFAFTILVTLGYSQGPTANFTGIPQTVCVGDPVTFTSTSTQGSSPITQYAWDFGDGNSANTQNTNHSYNLPGTYTVILVVTDQNNLADPEVKTNYITVNPNPTASFTASPDGCTLPVNVSFSNTSTSGANYSYSWDFGNGQNSNLQNPPAIAYNSANTYSVSLTVTNTTTGCDATTTNNIVVSNFTADFVIPDSVCVGSPVNFQDNSTIGVNTWAWNNGNGQNSANQNPVFTYNTPGTYTVTLNAQNTTSGCSDSQTAQIVVVPLPTPTFTATPTSGCIPLNVTFTNTSSNGSNFVWNFGDATTYNGTTPPVHTYNSNGTFTVTLTATGANGCVGTTTNTNLIQTTPPVANFNAPIINGCSPVTVNFTSTSTSSNPGSDPIISWSWDFGDGTTFNGQTPPAHVYTTGVYDVTLTITTQNGCTDSEIKPDYIQVGAIDLVDFSYSPPIQCAKSDVVFTDESIISAPHDPSEVTYHWDFGDNGTSTAQNPSWSYPSDTGYMDVELIVTFRGCKDTLTIDSAVYIKAPISLFNPAQTLYCNPGSFPVNVAVTDNAIIGQPGDDVKMVWKWGDGANSTTTFEDPDLDPDDDGSSSFNYTAYGTYTIEQVVYNYTTGCADSTTQNIIISQTVASFSLSNDSICRNGTVTLTSTSTSTNPFGTYSYNMGNGQTVTGSPVSYSYTTAGAYNITLTATNSVGCAATQTFIGMDVLQLPQASIVPSAIAGCAPITVTYTNNSAPQGNGFPTFSSFLWTFPDGSTQTTNSLATNTNYNFNTQGSFNTSLVATDGFGCVSAPTTVNMNITLPSPSFTVDSIVCDLEDFIAVNGSTGFGTLSYDWNIDNVFTSSTTDFNGSFDEISSSSSTSVAHVLTLIVTDGNGCIDSISKTMVVSMPYANLDYTFSGANMNGSGMSTCPPVFGTYDNQSTSIGTYTSAWNFGDGKSSTITDPNNTYVFAGTYSLSFQITDQFGCMDDTTLVDYLTIGGPSIEPLLTLTPDPCDNGLIFDTTNAVDVDHLLLDFGDGTSTTSLEAIHNYPTQGTYYTTLTIYDDLDCAIPYLDTITINFNQLDAAFSISPNEAYIGQSVTFTDQSLYNVAINTWEWQYGDFNNTSQINNSNAPTSFTYGLPYIYSVTLIITDMNGCIDSAVQTIHITGDIEVPNVFTPDGDGVNDIFEFPFDIFKSYDVVILNRWGNVVFENKNVTGTYIWNGKDMNKEECMDGVYFYLINGYFIDGVNFEKSGFLTKL